MNGTGAWVGQGLVYLAAAMLTGYFSQRPIYEHIPPDRAQITLSFVHGGKRVEKCRRVRYEEMRDLPANKRRPTTCKRERQPVEVELWVDGRLVYAAALPPTGIAGDGPSRAYEKFRLPAGRHRVLVRLDDRGLEDAFAYEKTVEVELAPRDKLAIDFKADKGGFLFYLPRR